MQKRRGCGIVSLITGLFVLPIVLIIIGNAAEAPRSIAYLTATPGDILLANAINLPATQPVLPSATPIPVTATLIPPTETVLPPVASSTAIVPTPAPRMTDTPATPEVVVLTHLMQPGETLYGVSLRYRTPLNAILIASQLTKESDAVAGMRVTIPVPVLAFSVDAEGNPHESSAPAPPPPAFTAAGDAPESLNGVALRELIQMPDDVQNHIREVYAYGQSLGRNPYAFSKVGDCNSESPHYLTRFDEGGYNLAAYEYLENTIEHFSGSYERQGMAVHRGFHSWTVFDPFWAHPSYCLPNETPVACEIRLNNPSIMLIRLGTNDKGVPASFESNMRDLVAYLLDEGVIPVLGTKADRFEGGNINNQILQEIASDYQIPLWDFDRLAGTLPGRGLGDDGVHMTTYFAHDYSSPIALQRGHSAQNLSALMVLDSILRTVLSET